jgi:16S rRNA (uracil1498-N3)-methyltransferase
VNPADVDAAAHVFVDDLAAPALHDDDHHHLARVLRVRDGDLVTVADGTGRWRPARMGTPLVPAGDVVTTAAAAPAVTICLALVKGDRPELAVQKLTELGADRVVLFGADRSVVRWDAARAARQRDRLRAVARAAAMQSRRARIPAVEVVGGFADVASLPGATLADRGGDPLSLAHPTVLVGPEGGWSDAERAAGLARVALSDAVLRAETAAITACAVLTTLRAREQRGADVHTTQGD